MVFAFVERAGKTEGLVMVGGGGGGGRRGGGVETFSWRMLVIGVGGAAGRERGGGGEGGGGRGDAAGRHAFVVSVWVMPGFVMC